jgi:hypothetical protein
LTCVNDIQAKAGDQVVIYQGAVLCVYKAPLVCETAVKQRYTKPIEAVLSVRDLTPAHRYRILSIILAVPYLALRTLRNYSPTTFPEGCKAWMMALRNEGLLTVEPSSQMTKRGTCYLITDAGKQFIKEYEDVRP